MRPRAQFENFGDVVKHKSGVENTCLFSADTSTKSRNFQEKKTNAEDI